MFKSDFYTQLQESDKRHDYWLILNCEGVLQTALLQHLSALQIGDTF